MDGKESTDDLGKSMSFAEFYKRIADGGEPTTAQVNVGQFKEYFTEFLKAVSYTHLDVYKRQVSHGGDCKIYKRDRRDREGYIYRPLYGKKAEATQERVAQYVALSLIHI